MVTSSPTAAAPSTPTGPLDLVIFGGAGDLSVRKLLPALYMAHLHHNLPEATRILALGRQPWDRDTFTAFIDDKVRGFIDAEALDDTAWTAFKDRLTYVCLDATQPDDFAALGAALRRLRWRQRPSPTQAGVGILYPRCNLITLRSRF
jgi:glucose-6-phosphate 1-dehydrogenase